MTQKVCARCQGERDYAKSSYCKDCRNAKQREWHASNRDRQLERKRRYREENRDRLRVQRRVWNYELTADQFIQLVQDQDGACAICKEVADLCIDHDHGTGKVRGLLCKACNTGLGMFRDNPDYMVSAINYLSRGQV